MGGHTRLVVGRAPDIEKVLGAIATNELVMSAVRACPDRDEAIAMLEADIASQGRELVAELRRIVQAHTARSVRDRVARDALLLRDSRDGVTADRPG